MTRRAREYLSSVTLVITGDDLDPDYVSRRLSLRPDRTWRKGDVNLPRFGRHPRSHESAVGVCHGQTQAAGVHEGVQGAGRSDRSGEREVRGGGGAGTGSAGKGAPER